MTNEYDRYFQQYACLYFDGLVSWPWLKAQGIAESNLRADAVSPVGARGIMQIMPATAKEIGQHLRIVPNLTEPRLNIMFGVHYLRQMWDIFKNERGLERLRFAFGAYNAGAGNIIEAQKLERRDNDKWATICATLPKITGQADAQQTIDYVRRIEEARLALIEV